jgi:hypothetical protein
MCYKTKKIKLLFSFAEIKNCIHEKIIGIRKYFGT